MFDVTRVEAHTKQGDSNLPEEATIGRKRAEAGSFYAETKTSWQSEEFLRHKKISSTGSSYNLLNQRTRKMTAQHLKASETSKKWPG
jgi:hypothetical protein